METTGGKNQSCASHRYESHSDVYDRSQAEIAIDQLRRRERERTCGERGHFCFISVSQESHSLCEGSRARAHIFGHIFWLWNLRAHKHASGVTPEQEVPSAHGDMRVLWHRGRQESLQSLP